MREHTLGVSHYKVHSRVGGNSDTLQIEGDGGADSTAVSEIAERPKQHVGGHNDKHAEDDYELKVVGLPHLVLQREDLQSTTDTARWRK